jgi:hypothetical protein
MVDRAFGDWAGDVQESFLDLAEDTRWLKGQQGISTSRRALKDDVGPCSVKTVEAIYCPQQRICGWLRYVG